MLIANKARQYTSPHQNLVEFSKSTHLYIIKPLVNYCREKEISGILIRFGIYLLN